MMSENMPLWGKTPHRLVELDDAWSAISADLKPRPSVEIPLVEAAGRTLAEPVYATEDYPAFDKAMMDGFAVRSADCSSSGATLRIVGLRQAGAVKGASLSHNESVQINTGAPVLEGADAVVRIEDTAISSDGQFVTINAVAKKGQNINPRGSDRRSGELLLPAPIDIAASQLAALATAGRSTVQVYDVINAAIVTTGNEIAPVGQPRKPGEIVDSNGPMLAALLSQFGACPLQFGIVPDDKSRLTDAFTEALRHPLVVVVGGMSMGTHDLSPGILADLGVEWRFHGVRVRPGKPVAFGVGPDGQFVFGLPGNPVSAFVCSWLFIQMTIRGMRGHPARPPKRLVAKSARQLEAKRDGRPAFVPARMWQQKDGVLYVDPCAWGGSGDPFGLTLANALLMRRDPTRAVEIFEDVECIPLQLF